MSGERADMKKDSEGKVITPLCSTQPQCKALYDFDEEGCLSFIKGEIITVIRRVDENWAKGKLGERIGIFPLALVDLNPVARSLMELSTNSQPGPSRVAPPTQTSEDTAPLIPTDHTRSVSAVPVSGCRSPAAVAATVTGPPPHVHTRSRAAVASDSSSTQSSPSSATTPNTSSGNTSSGSGSGTEPSSPASPPLARPPPDPTLPSPALGSGTAAPPPRPTPSVQQRDKRHSFSAVHTGHHQTSHRLSAEILGPSETSCQDPSSSDQTLQMNEPSTSDGRPRGIGGVPIIAAAAAAAAAAEAAVLLEEAATAAIGTAEECMREIDDLSRDTEAALENLVTALENCNEDEESVASTNVIRLIKAMALPLQKAADTGAAVAKDALNIINKIKNAAKAKPKLDKGRHRRRGNLRGALRVVASAARAATAAYKRAKAAFHAAKSARVKVAEAAKALILAHSARDDSLIDRAEIAVVAIKLAILAVQQQVKACLSVAHATDKFASAISEAADADPAATAAALSAALNSV